MVAEGPRRRGKEAEHGMAGHANSNNNHTKVEQLTVVITANLQFLKLQSI